MGAPHIPLMLELHAEDAAVLWLQRDRAVDAPHYNMTFLGRLDERLEANLDGLRVAGDAGWEQARLAFMTHPEGGEMFVLAALAFARGRAEDREIVLAALADDAAAGLVRPAISALGWLRPDELAGKVQPLLDDPRPVARLLGLGACSVHRIDPRTQLERFLADHPPVRARALRLAGELGRHDLLPKVLGHLDDEANECGHYAAWSAALLGERRVAPARLRDRAAKRGPRRWAALDLALRLLDPQGARRWLQEQRDHPDGLLFRVRAAGVLAEVALLPFLIEQMRDPAVARVAAESFSTITGIDLAFADLDGPAPDGFEPGPNDDPDDLVTDLDPDNDLPWPDPAAVEAWHAAEATALRQVPRRFVGHTWGEQAFAEVFSSGFQRQRRAAALNLALRSPGERLKNWRSRCRPASGHA